MSLARKVRRERAKMKALFVPRKRRKAAIKKEMKGKVAAPAPEPTE